MGCLRVHPFPFLAGSSRYLGQEVAAGELILIKSFSGLLSFIVIFRITQPSTRKRDSLVSDEAEAFLTNRSLMLDFRNSYLNLLYFLVIPKENELGPITGDSPGGMSLDGCNGHIDFFPNSW